MDIADKLLELADLFPNVMCSDMNDDEIYVAFILGRDLIDDYIPPENDYAFELCSKLAVAFWKSPFNDMDKSMYDCLVEFVNHILEMLR